MDKDIAVECTHLYKEYSLYHGDFQRLKGLFLPHYKAQEFTALSDINVTIKKGEIMGVIGLNGSGKSTLSSIIAGITHPTEGVVNVDGDVNMLSANAGMENNLTGIENIKYKCLLMGLDKKSTELIQDDIIEFADIGMYIDQPLRTYSSGMRSRLGFAISVHMNPDILIIDEALSVGDSSFADKCLEKMNQIKNNNKTIIFVSHAVTQMEEFCDKVMWLHKGQILGIEKPENIIKPYCGFARDFNSMTIDERQKLNLTLKEYQEKYL